MTIEAWEQKEIAALDAQRAERGDTAFLNDWAAEIAKSRHISSMAAPLDWTARTALAERYSVRHFGSAAVERAVARAKID